MIVTCPACTSRYQFGEDKLKGRSAKITCPKCSHVYIVHPPTMEPALNAETWPSAAAEDTDANTDGPEPSVDIDSADFTEHGVTWKVRQGLGLVHDFSTLAEVREALDDDIIGDTDEISHDGRMFQRISTIDDLDAHFRHVWELARSGEVKTEETQHMIIGDDGDEDAPTTIVRTGNALTTGLDDPPDEADGATPLPPPAAPLSVVPSSARGGSESPTEELAPTLTGAAAPSTSAIPSAPGAAAAAAAESSSRLPLIALLLVVVAVIVLILWSQGVFNGLGG